MIGLSYPSSASVASSSPIAGTGVVSSMSVRSHTFVEIYHETFSTSFSFPMIQEGLLSVTEYYLTAESKLALLAEQVIISIKYFRSLKIDYALANRVYPANLMKCRIVRYLNRVSLFAKVRI